MTVDKARELKALLSDPIYKPLTEFLIKVANELKNIDNVRELADPIAQAVELKACKLAYNKIEEILNTIMEIKSIPDQIVEANEPLDDHGLESSQKEK